MQTADYNGLVKDGGILLTKRKTFHYLVLIVLRSGKKTAIIFSHIHHSDAMYNFKRIGVFCVTFIYCHTGNTRSNQISF